jgi:hypothetical protein
MRTLYTILFFADTILFVALTYIFLQRFESGSNLSMMMLITAGMAACVLLLVFLLKNYIKQ